MSNIRRKHFKKIFEKAAFPDMKMYDLRHTMATFAPLENVHAKKVQNRLGLTLRRYRIDLDTFLIEVINTGRKDHIILSQEELDFQ